jgi:hypothetical protein
MEERPWAERGPSRRPITPSQLAKLLKPFDIAPRNIRLDAIVKGYLLSDFAEVWARYFTLTGSSDLAATPLQPNGENDCSAVAATSGVGGKEFF